MLKKNDLNQLVSHY